MARIRTIKPEFWTDQKIVRLPLDARLLFIGLWNFADDDGFVLDEPDRIRMQVFPDDDFDVDRLLDLLNAAGMIERVELEGDRPVIFLPKFLEHQRISRPTPSRFRHAAGRKGAFTSEVRRMIAVQYSCQPGAECAVTCRHCGRPGSIWWPKTNRGKPGEWVAFGDVGIERSEPDQSGRYILTCRACEKARGYPGRLPFKHSSNSEGNSVSQGTNSLKIEGGFFNDAPLTELRDEITESGPKITESDLQFNAEGKGKEGKGKEGKGRESFSNEKEQRSAAREELEHSLRRSAGLTEVHAQGLSDLSPIIQLLDDGFDLAEDVLPVLRARQKPNVRSWKYFVAAIREAKENRLSIAATESLLRPIRPTSGALSAIAGMDAVLANRGSR